MNDSRTKRRSEKLWEQPQATAHAETALFIILGLAGLVAVVIAGLWASMPARSRAGSLATYVRSGQAMSDARTAKAIVEYLFEPDSPLTNNAPQTEATQSQLRKAKPM